MSSDNCMVLQLYWGGKIIYKKGSISYDPPIPKNVLFLTEVVGYDELVDRIYTSMGLDRNSYKISLIYRSCLQNGKFGAMPLVNDNGVAGLYYLQSGSRLATEIYVEVEKLLGLEEHGTDGL